jgi:antitoxin MazE
MRTSIVSIGNSKGIRIPKVILKQFDIEDQVDLEIEKNRIVIRPVKGKPRAGWDKAFKTMHERHEDAPLISDIDIDMEGWEWK